MPGVRIEVPSPGADLVVVEDSIPECPPRGLVIKTTSSGICHSDVHLWRDQWRVKDDVAVSLTTFSDDVKWPMVLGHEVCGVVHAIGKDASGEPENLKVGDQVVVFPWVGCGDCNTCKSGRTNICPLGPIVTDIGLGVVPGGYQSYVSVQRKNHVLHVAEEIPSHIACMFGCSALTAFHAASRARPSIESAAKFGEAHFLIIGAGGLGLWCIQIARAMYPPNTKIFVADVAEDKLEVAKKYGADGVVLWSRGADEAELIARTKQVTGGIDGSADFVGIPSTCTKTYEASNRGATMSLIGLCGGTFPVPLVSTILNDVTVAGTYVGTRQQMADLVDLFNKKQLTPPPLIHVQPDGANDALHKLYQGQVPGRAIINFKGIA